MTQMVRVWRYGVERPEWVNSDHIVSIRDIANSSLHEIVLTRGLPITSTGTAQTAVETIMGQTRKIGES